MQEHIYDERLLAPMMTEIKRKIVRKNIIKENEIQGNFEK